MTVPGWLKDGLLAIMIGGASGGSAGTAMADSQITKAKSEVISTVEQKIVNAKFEIHQEEERADTEQRQMLLRIESKLDAVQTEIVDLKIAVAKEK